MLALLVHAPIKNMAQFYLTFREESIEKKTSRLISKGINDTFFVYAPNKELKHFWNLIHSNHSLKLVNVKYLVLVEFVFIYCLTLVA